MNKCKIKMNMIKEAIEKFEQKKKLSDNCEDWTIGNAYHVIGWIKAITELKG